ncbi:MAG: hydrogenase formation protein HypD, partial [Phycisphaeraceae bacterium]
MNRRRDHVRVWLARLYDAAEAIGRPIAFMEVCGTHTVSAFRCGLHSLMPANVTLLSGPGCPVCVTSQGDIDQYVEVASRPGLTLCTYGDMLRVPGRRGSLEQARGQGADVRIVFSTMDAVRLAAAEPKRQIVFAAIGFETTAPATAVAVLEADRLGLKNFSVLVSHKLVVPAMRALLEGGKVRVHGFLCPGHVSVIIGAEAYRSIVRDYGVPCVIAGFEDVQMAVALTRLVEQVRDGKPDLENTYPEAVNALGNPAAQKLIRRVFHIADEYWRGLGTIPNSGLTLRAPFRQYDAAARFGLDDNEAPEPAGCRCGEVITGQCTPRDCKLFATGCTPIHPIGPCMVSSEGTCQAWF